MNTTSTKPSILDMADDLPFATGSVALPVVNEQTVEQQLAKPITPKTRYTEPCPKCRGTGTWMSFSGRTGGKCFACKGVGSKTFNTSPEQRRNARNAAAKRKVREEEELNAAIAAWAAEHPAEHAWMVRKSATFDFALSMHNALLKWGHLTPNQLAAVQKCVARDAERQAAKAAEKAANPDPRLDALHTVMQKHAKFYAGDLTLSRRNADQLVWIKHANSEKVVGKIDGGVLSLWNRPGVNNAEIKAMLEEFNAAPLETAMKYGKLSGRCCSCGRDLTNDDSIEAGIGPICASKFE